ncbi:uncharacterized protein LOC128642705 [Bombina bombina]|uniref:uncharacterized protein LOC128642705 n=1 Tax=Bombina bombina TaxID=8345 RepID=UPI00235ABE96|nr:uncharacterized protein LOC128642705 [Bombina bombina]
MDYFMMDVTNVARVTEITISPNTWSDHTMAFLTVLLNTLHGTQVLNAQLPVLDLLVCVFFAVSSCLLIYRNPLHGSLNLSQSISDPLLPFLRVDFLATFMFGLLWLAYPDWLLGFQVVGTLDSLHLHITRAFGAMMIGDSFVSVASQWFHIRQDKTSVLTSRAAATSILLLFMIWTQNTTRAWTVAHIWFGMLGAALWTANSLLGYLKADWGKKSV